MLVANFELDILQAKRVFRITCCVGVFSRSKEKIKSHPDAVNGGLITGGGRGENRGAHKDRHRDRLNSSRGRVLLLPRSIHACEAEVLFASVVQPGVYGPQAGKFLADKPNRVLNQASAVCLVGDSAVTPAEAKGLEKWDRINHF